MAGTTGLEPATSAVTGQRSNQLSYVPKFSATSVIDYEEKDAAIPTPLSSATNSLSLPDTAPICCSVARFRQVSATTTGRTPGREAM